MGQQINLRIRSNRTIRSAGRWALIVVAGLALAPDSALAEAAKQIVVRPAAYFRDGNDCIGSTLRLQIEAQANPSGGIQVGFFESSAGAIGDQMNASGWLAALVSAELLGSDLRDHRLSYTWAGLVDGPSAGGLMTSGIVALLRGDSLPPDVSMTGTINPDGTIGPVGGIAHKIAGAATANIKRLAIPLGKRQDTNKCTGEAEDVVEIGRALGVEVAEVGDIHEAYAFLTGVTLPKPPRRPVETRFPEDLREDYRTLYQAWLARYRAASSIVTAARPQDIPQEFRAFWSDAEAFLSSSDSELRSGHEAAAFNRIWMAVLNAEFVARSVGAMRALTSQGFPALNSVVEQEIEASRQYLAAGLSELRDLKIESVVDAGAVSGIGNLVASSLAFLVQARAELAEARELTRNATPQDFEKIGRLSFAALAHSGLAGPVLDLALALRGWMGRDPQAWSGNPVPILTDRDLFLAAARSNLAYVDSLHTAKVAKKDKLDMESARAQVRRNDPTYLAASGALSQQEGFLDFFDDPAVASVAQLGALMGSVANASLLVAKYYSIGAEIDELGRVTGLQRRSALEKMMAVAEETAEIAIGEADAATNGASTPMLLVALDTARRNRDEMVAAQDQLTALGYFWGATMTARLMTKLARAN